MSSADEIPSTMKRLVVTAPGKDVASCKIEIEEVAVPKPASGEVLIKVVASAINPSDYGSWSRCRPDQCPYAMGKEGCGIVVALGGGLSTYATGVHVGSKVGFVNLKHKQGAYSEYVVADVVGGTFSMPEDLPIENAASFFVNPFTAIAIIDSAKKLGAKSFVHTAAASQLGQMLVKLAPSEGVEIINVVRREEQAELLKNIGAKHVVVTGGGDDDGAWKEDLRSKVEELGATVAFDAVAGQSTGDMLDALPRKATVFLYGGLAGRAGNINPMDLIYHEKKVEGFLLTRWIQDGGMLGTVSMVPRMLSAGKKVTAGLNEGGWSSSQFLDTTLENAHADLVKLLDSKATGQKLRIRLDAP